MPKTPKASSLSRLGRIATCLLPVLAVLLTPAISSAAAHAGHARYNPRASLSPHMRVAATHRAKTRRARRVNRVLHLAANSAVSGLPSGATVLDAGFENGLANWNTGGVGDVTPTVTSDVVRSGSRACDVELTGNQDRSELILGGNGSGSTAGMVEFHEGAEYWYGFSFDIQSMVYGHPGAHNLIMQFKSDGEGSPNFGLQLWDYAGDDGHSGGRGLWSTGEGMGGDRFLAPVSEKQWHDVAIHFKASSQGAGFYQVYLDGQLVDSREGASMIVPGHSYGYIKNGLYRNGDAIPGTSDIRIDAARLGTSLSSVLPG